MLHATETIASCVICSMCHTFEKYADYAHFLNYLCTLVFPQLVHVSMRPEGSHLLTFTAHASGFSCDVLIFPIRACGQKEGNRKRSLAMNFCECPFYTLIEDIQLFRAYPYSEEKRTGCVLSPTVIVLQNALL